MTINEETFFFFLVVKLVFLFTHSEERLCSLVGISLFKVATASVR